MVNKVFLLGHCGSDPETRVLNDGTMVSNFSLATSEAYKNKSGEMVTNTQWHTIVAWRHLADLADTYIRKGKQLFIEGKITYRTYEDKEGNRKGTTEIVAENIRLLGLKPEPAKSPENDQKKDVNKTATIQEPALPIPDDVNQPTSDELPF